MLQIEKTVISLDLLEKKFKCDLLRCHGNCCVYGDAGAPLENLETEILEEIFPILKKYLRSEGVQAIEKLGTHVIDDDGEEVTPLIKGKECAYTIIENGVYLCGIEKAFMEKKISFQKPISCHLFPVRVKKLDGLSGLNYERWNICRHAIELGEREDMPVYLFAKDALIRKFGKDWYHLLERAAEELDSLPKPVIKK